MEDDDWDEVRVSCLVCQVDTMRITLTNPSLPLTMPRFKAYDSNAADKIAQNFMKCLMKMFAKENKGVLFYETILSFKQQRHTVIECVPMPAEQFQDAPAYFRVCPLTDLVVCIALCFGFILALVSNL
jgi:hypothetical protein